MKLKDLKDKNILILGFGKEGEDSFLALRKLFPKKVLGIGDRIKFSNLIKKDKHLKLHFGKNYLQYLKNYNLIIKTPGIPLSALKPFLKKGTKVVSQTEIFFENCPGTIIGITGTKGKGTVSSLIYRILKQGNLPVRLVGNIGKPVFKALLKAKKKDVFVYELSSHQLQNIKKSPYVAVFLNIYPAHLDYYKTFQRYLQAKENITFFQKKDAFLIYNSSQKELKKIAKKSKAKKIPLSPKLAKGEWLFFNKQKIMPKKEIPLKGDFNAFNVLAAIAVGKIFNVPVQKIRKAIKTFRPLPFRLNFVGTYRGIEFYNDSLATVPQAVEFALSALGKRVKTLILGGSNVPGFNFAGLAKKILGDKVKTIIFLSAGKTDTCWKIRKEIMLHKKKTLPKTFFAHSMQEAVKLAYQTTKKGEICLLSPGSPSFNLFRDYKERGDLFNFFVKKFAYER